jgi:hypothetical protein
MVQAFNLKPINSKPKLPWLPSLHEIRISQNTMNMRPVWPGLTFSSRPLTQLLICGIFDGTLDKLVKIECEVQHPGNYATRRVKP